jgi:hypothetical protein
MSAGISEGTGARASSAHRGRLGGRQGRLDLHLPDGLGGIDRNLGVGGNQRGIGCDQAVLERQSENFQPHFTQTLRILDQLLLKIIYSTASPDSTQPRSGGSEREPTGKHLHEGSAFVGLSSELQQCGAVTHETADHAKGLPAEQLQRSTGI